jgi:hypothetical protein
VTHTNVGSDSITSDDPEKSFTFRLWVDRGAEHDERGLGQMIFRSTPDMESWGYERSTPIVLAPGQVHTFVQDCGVRWLTLFPPGLWR